MRWVTSVMFEYCRLKATVRSWLARRSGVIVRGVDAAVLLGSVAEVAGALGGGDTGGRLRRRNVQSDSMGSSSSSSMGGTGGMGGLGGLVGMGGEFPFCL